MIIKTIITVILFFIGIAIQAQHLEVFGGINFNKFHDYNGDNPHYSSSYDPGQGFIAGIALDSLRVDWSVMRFMLQFENYRGELNVKQGGLGGGSSITASVEKSLLTLGIYPFCFHLFHVVDLNFGLHLSLLIHDSYKGTISGWTIDQPNYSYDLNDRYDRYNNSFYAGAAGRIAYPIRLSPSFQITPQYVFYFGFSDEFVESPGGTKSMRHNVGIGIRKRIGGK